LSRSALNSKRKDEIIRILSDAGVTVNPQMLKTQLIDLYIESAGTTLTSRPGTPAPIEVEPEPSNVMTMRSRSVIPSSRTIQIPIGVTQRKPIPISLPLEAVNAISNESPDIDPIHDVISSAGGSIAESIDRSSLIGTVVRNKLTPGKASKEYYTLHDMRNIARALGIDYRGNKPVLYQKIIAKLDELGIDDLKK